jgi:hypothetical protein
MIEYSIEELKHYYNKYDEYDNDDAIRMNVNYLEKELSNIIDHDYTHNNIYHIFPIFACIFIGNLIISFFIVT